MIKKNKIEASSKGGWFLYHRDTIWMLETVINQDFNLAELTTETEMFMHYYRLEEEATQYLFRQWLKWPERAETMRVQPLRVHRGKDTRDSWSGATWRTAVFALRQVTGSAHISKMRYSEEKMTARCSRGTAACRLTSMSGEIVILPWRLSNEMTETCIHQDASGLRADLIWPVHHR